MLRQWRERRRISQLELALRADSSARHVSFLENGRSRPSQAMVLKLAEHLDVPIRERNTLLVAAGYAPVYGETSLADPSMDGLRAAVERLLEAHDPYPAVVVDGGYDLVAANRSMSVLLEGVAGHLLEPPANALRITFHPEGLAPHILNLKQWRENLLERLRRHIAVHQAEVLTRLHDEIKDFPAPPGHQDVGQELGETSFALPLRLRHRGRELAFIGAVSTFNSPWDVTVSELAMETFLPANPETAKAVRGWV
ncbi:helix-turn-helix domain-containing protein [Wenjunlia tyrosinilytica]|uniref:helix-turn-helix domain-containing protein n=1 Tax=Wenjunlia tyrosinilytica TaxID=1544741 RepID=UPI001E48F34E|nr:helix-turn-helix transcriptional regulator [Wenjunlia tyrosinilytica]